MRLGTKSLLFGSHQFLLHPLMVALAWWRLYGFPRHPLLWLCFLVHDWGYWGKPNMDGPEGDEHPELGARIAGLFGMRWWWMCRYHSRFMAKRDGRNVSPLCAADKLGVAMLPAWLYVPMARASGELWEYMNRCADPNDKYAATASGLITGDGDPSQWFREVAAYLARWAWEHRDGRYDTWTQGASAAEANRAPAIEEATP